MTISSAELKSLVKYWALVSSFSSSQKLPPKRAAMVLSNFAASTDKGTEMTITIAQRIVRTFHSVMCLRLVFL